jgi:hypothetical protein
MAAGRQACAVREQLERLGLPAGWRQTCRRAALAGAGVQARVWNPPILKCPADDLPAPPATFIAIRRTRTATRNGADHSYILNQHVVDDRSRGLARPGRASRRT